MKVALAALGLLGLTSCVRATEGIVREQAAVSFACADYALQVEEIGPDVYRAAGCGQELIYTCHPSAPHVVRTSLPEPPRETEEVADIGDAPVMECARRP